MYVCFVLRLSRLKIIWLILYLSNYSLRLVKTYIKQKTLNVLVSTPIVKG